MRSLRLRGYVTGELFALDSRLRGNDVVPISRPNGK